MASSVFGSVSGNHPGRSVFDLSYTKKFTCDAGFAIPLLCDEMVPGDTFTISNQLVIRMAPLVAPIMHEIYYKIHTFFVPTRLLLGSSNDKTRGATAVFGYSPRYPDGEVEWEQFLTGGPKNDKDFNLPLWPQVSNSSNYRDIGSLWDYLGFPTGVSPHGAQPLAFSKRAYNLIWFHYYRDSNLSFAQSVFDIDDEHLKCVCWEKDYFTSALPFQQRGVSPSFPLNMQFSFTDSSWQTWLDSIVSDTATTPAGFDASTPNGGNPVLRTGSINGSNNAAQFFSDMSQSLASALMSGSTVGFDMTDLRTAVQLQRYMELSARTGYRLNEFLRAHFGTAPYDATLQRPEYIGGLKSPLVISEVLQTSSTDATSPQGEMAGHGITADQGYIGKYTAREHGYIVSIFSIMPKPVYQQGINRQWLRRNRYDFYFPEFAHLSEQLIMNAELMVVDGNAGHNAAGFGYQGVYDEMRYKPSMICGNFRDTLKHWHLSRIFDPASPPVLNYEFVQGALFNGTTNPVEASTVRKDVFAFYAQDPLAHGFYVNAANIIKAVRPLPYYPTPGRMDHV